MTWTNETSCGYESDKIATFVVPYTRGTGLDIGCGARKVWPHVIGVDSGQDFGAGAQNINSKADNLSLIADGSLDFIFSSHLLEHIEREKVDALLAMWTSKLKVGAYLVLYLPSANFYPKCGQPGANPFHRWDIYPGDVEKILQQSTECGWTQLECEERSQTNEYSLYEVYQKRDDGIFEKKPWQRNPEGKKRVLVIRYGAVGDQIIASSILKGLKQQGYHVTYSTTPPSDEVIKHNPYIDDWLIQDKDQVPNSQLGAYWQTLEERYDKIINLCESVEKTLLTMPGHIFDFYSDEARRKVCDVNYLERTHDIADVPHDFSVMFYATDEELEEARKIRQEIDAPVIVWTINGSSAHKVYPWTQVVLAWLMQHTPAHVFIYSDPTIGVQLQKGILDTLKEDEVDISRIHPVGGKWELRQSLTFLKFADCIVGPETGPLNVASFEDVPKVIYLSHSSHENLTKHWKNTTVLTPDKAACPCYPCHRLHFDWSRCKQVEETAASLCASSIKPETIYETILKVLKEKIPKKEAA